LAGSTTVDAVTFAKAVSAWLQVKGQDTRYNVAHRSHNQQQFTISELVGN